MSKNTNNFLNKNGFLMDGNEQMLVLEENKLDKEIREIKDAIKKKKILKGRVSGIEVKDDKYFASLKYGETIIVFIEVSDFVAYSLFKNIENDSKDDVIVRQYRKALSFTKGIVSFIPIAMVEESSTGYPFVVGSRKQALEALRDRFFFGPEPIAKVGDKAVASIIASGPKYIWVECLGTESVIASGDLSAYSYIENVSDTFKVGQSIPVVIEKLKIDREEKTIDIKLSHKLYETMNAPVFKVNDSMLYSRYYGRVMAVTQSYYIIMITDLKIRGVIRKADYAGENALRKGDEILFLTTQVDHNKNLLRGKAILIDR